MSGKTSTRRPALLPEGTWALDAAESSIGFQFWQRRFQRVRGRFGRVDATLRVGGDIGAEARGTVVAASIDTGSEQRDERLRGADFLHTEAHPEIRFRTKAITSIYPGRIRALTELTVRGVTRELEMTASVEAPGGRAELGERMRIQGHVEVDRRDFGVDAPGPALLAGMGPVVRVVLDVTAVRVA